MRPAGRVVVAIGASVLAHALGAAAVLGTASSSEVSPENPEPRQVMRVALAEASAQKVVAADGSDVVGSSGAGGALKAKGRRAESADANVDAPKSAAAKTAVAKTAVAKTAAENPTAAKTAVAMSAAAMSAAADPAAANAAAANAAAANAAAANAAAANAADANAADANAADANSADANSAGANSAGANSKSSSGGRTSGLPDLVSLHSRIQQSAERCYASSGARFRLRGNVTLELCVDSRGQATKVARRGTAGSPVLDRAAEVCVVPGAEPLPVTAGCYSIPVQFRPAS